MNDELKAAAERLSCEQLCVAECTHEKGHLWNAHRQCQWCHSMRRDIDVMELSEGVLSHFDAEAQRIEQPMKLRTDCHPEANGRKPQYGDTAWKIRIKLEDSRTLEIDMGKKGRDLLFGMLIADCADHGEREPEAAMGVETKKAGE